MGQNLGPHPRMIGPEGIKTELSLTHVSSPRAKVHICGDDVAIGLSLGDGVEKTLWIIRWVLGTTLLLRDCIFDAKFVSPRKLLVACPSESNERFHLSLLYLQGSLESLHFELPICVSDIHRLDLIVSPAARYDAAPKGPFERQSLPWETDPDLDICALEIESRFRWKKTTFLIVIRVQSLDTFGCEGRLSETFISWDEWGPQSTRWFKIPGRHYGATIYGSKLYWELPPGGLEQLTSGSEEFNPPGMAIYFRPIATFDFNPRNMGLTDDTDRPLPLGQLVDETWTHTWLRFTCAVKCSLPFVVYAGKSEMQIFMPKGVAHEGSYIVDITQWHGEDVLRVRSFVCPSGDIQT